MATQAQTRFEPLQIRTDGTPWLRWIETVAVHHAGPNGSQPLTIATLESASVFTPSDEDANAYAQLFAAAPDLYAALERILDAFQGEWATAHEQAQAMIDAEGALMKARGESMNTYTQAYTRQRCVVTVNRGRCKGQTSMTCDVCNVPVCYKHRDAHECQEKNQ